MAFVSCENKLYNKGSEAFLLNLYFTYLTGLIFFISVFYRKQIL